MIDFSDGTDYLKSGIGISSFFRRGGKDIIKPNFLIQEEWESSFSSPPLAKAETDENPSQADIEKAKQKKAVKKRFGITRDPDLEGLRQAIVVEDKPDVSFDDIVGQDSAVKEARDLSKLLAHPELFKQYGIDPPRGILFYGPPGTGKTMIVKALANEANSGFVLVKASDLASKWYGDSEKFAKGVFTIAREQAEETGHCILYIDEVDSILPPRNGGLGTHEVTNRVIGTFLQEIDGLGTEEGKITVVASTNIPDNVDPAFLSRMSAWIEVPLPDETGRSKIFQNHFSKAAAKAGKESFLDQSVDLTQIGTRTEGLSGRDIADLVQIILTRKALKSIDTGYTPVTQDDILEAFIESAKTRDIKREVRARNQRIGFRPPNEKT